MKRYLPTLQQVKRNSLAITDCKTTQQLAKLINSSERELILQTFEPIYYHFKVPKKSGKFRQIEAPAQDLKQIQRNLNVYLQAVYYLNQSKASYGYIIKAKGEKLSKNIYTNALCHLGHDFMLNADFKDFFHQITINDVFNIFKNKPFIFDISTAHLLSKICCYHKRLPMGAPTSPVLSNFYTLALDKALINWSQQNKINFTRFVDDLTFSSNTVQLNKFHYQEVSQIAEKQHLIFNQTKIKYFSKTDVKTVTGLVLNDTVDIDESYYNELDNDIIRLKKVMEVYYITGKVNSINFLKVFKQELMGKINFISTIEGKYSEQYKQYLNAFNNALQPQEDLIARWTQFSNYM